MASQSTESNSAEMEVEELRGLDTLNSSTVALLSDWQKAQVENMTYAGVRCMMDVWFNASLQITEGLYCEGTWDTFYCWPPTVADSNVNVTCREVFESDPRGKYLEGHAHRACLPDGTWSLGRKTDYEECATSWEALENQTTTQREFVSATEMRILYIGSLISFLLLLVAIFTFQKMRSLHCARVSIQMHLMSALVVRYALLLIITHESFIFKRNPNFRQVDWICKMVICVFLYGTMASIFWMFAFGLFMNRSVSSAHGGNPQKLTTYYLIGWGLPVVFMAIYIISMVTSETQAWCWSGYSARKPIWIVILPMIAVLFVNVVFLLNIAYVVYRKLRNRAHPDWTPYKATFKAALVLFLYLGVYHLTTLIEWPVAYRHYQNLMNTSLSATQGIVAAFLFCFTNTKVHEAVKRSCTRFLASRDITWPITAANRIRRLTTTQQQVTTQVSNV